MIYEGTLKLYLQVMTVDDTDIDNINICQFEEPVVAFDRLGDPKLFTKVLS